MFDRVDSLSGQKSRERRPTSVSQILKAIGEEFKSGATEWDVPPAGERQHEYHITVAADRETRRRAYALAHRVYKQHGFVPDDGKSLLVTPYDADPNTLTLLAQDESGRDAATISLVFDSPAGLFADEIFGAELQGLREQGRRLIEVTRLVIADEHQNSKMLLTRLYNLVYIFGRHVRGYDDFVIEVSTRHAPFYNRLLLFSQAGSERPCPRVQGASGVLMRLDLHRAEAEVRRGATDHEGRTLMRQFYSWLEEGAVAEYLMRTHKPMSSEDMAFFGLANPAMPMYAAAAN